MAGSYKIFKPVVLLFALFCLGRPQTFESISQNFCAELSGDVFPDNLSCPNETIETGACFNRALLCNGILDCVDPSSSSNDGIDEGVEDVLSALECDDPNDQSTSMFDCGNGVEIPLTQLCDGTDDCATGARPGDDETTIFCDNKCLADYYGSCDVSRQCVNSRNGVNCGDCFPGPGVVDVPGEAFCPILTIPNAIFQEGVDNPQSVCATLAPPVRDPPIMFSTTNTFSVSVDVTFSPVTADLNGDYVPITTSLMFTESDLSDCIEFDIVDNNIIENTETFTISAAGESGTITIMDNDVPIFGFSADTFTGSEEAGFVQTQVEITNGVVPSFLISVDCVKSISGVGPMFASIGDFPPLAIALPFVVDFFPLEDVKLLFIPVFNDNIPEQTEQFRLTLQDPSFGSVSTTAGTATGFIEDTDSPVVYVTFVGDDIWVDEDAGTVQFCLELANFVGGSPSPVSVTVVSGDSTATVAGLDYSAVDMAIFFPAGTLAGPAGRMCRDAVILDDRAFEKDETFTLNIVSTSDNVIPHIATFTVIIHDDETAYLTITEDSITVYEDVGVVEVCVEISQLEVPTQIAIWADLFSQDFTAIGGLDFDIVDVTVTFPPGSFNGDQQCFDVSITNDMAFEKDEYFVIHFGDVEENVETHSFFLTIHIHDDDFVYIQFVTPIFEVEEGDAAQVCVELSNAGAPTGAPIWLSIETQDDSALDGRDYSALPADSSLVIPEGSNNGEPVCIPIQTAENNFFQKRRIFSVHIGLLEFDRGLVIHDPYALVYINNDDFVYVSFVSPILEVDEDSKDVTVCVVLTDALAPIADPIWLSIASENGSAISGRDFEGIDSTLVIPAGSFNGDTVCTDIRICDNRAFQKTRIFSVHIGIVEVGDTGIVFHSQYVFVHIFNVDLIYLSFLTPSFEVEEGHSVRVTVCVELSRAYDPTDDPIWLGISSQDGSAIGGRDFESINTSLVFPLGSVQGDISCIDIRIYDNLAFSKTRIFSVHIAEVEIGDRGLVIHDPYANVSIFNNDAVYFQFVSPTFEVDEGAPFPLINICVELNEADVPTEDAIWISFDTQDDTAISGVDFFPLVTILSFPANSIEGDTQCAVVFIIDDPFFQKSIYFNAHIAVAEDDSADDIIIHVAYATVHIINDDFVWLQFTSDTFSVDENTDVTVCVEVAPGFPQAPIDDPIWLGITTEDDTALSGRDYAGINSTLVIPAGSTPFGAPVCTTIRIFHIRPFQKTRYFFVRIAVLEVGEGVLIHIPLATVHIFNIDPVYINFLTPTFEVNENVPDVQVCLELSQAADPIVDPIWLTISSEDVTAISGVDYEALNTTVSFPVNSQQGDTVCTPIGIIDRRAFQKTRSFTVHIGIAELTDSGIVIHAFYATVIIFNIDFVYIQFTETIFETTEGATDAQVCLELNQADLPIESAIWVGISSEDDTALDGRDYNGFNTSLVFPENSDEGDTVCTSVDILENLAFHNNRIFTVHIGLVDLGDRGVTIHQFYASFLILNNDGIFIGLTEPIFTVQEDGRDAVVCLELTGAVVPTESAVWISITSQNGTAFSERDFEAVDTTVAFDEGSNDGDVVCTDIRIFDDRAFQKTRVFSVHIGQNIGLFETGPLEIELLRIYAEVQILNIDIIYFQFTSTIFQVAENSGEVQVCVELNQATLPIEDPVWLSIATADGSALDEVDYEAINTTIMFPASSIQGNSMCVPIRVFDSRAFQKIRIFSVHIAVVDFDPSGVTIHVACAQVFILNIDIVTLMFTQPIYDVTEGQPSVTVCLELSGADLPTASPIWANISTSDGDAIDGPDYSGVDVALALPVNSDNGDTVCQMINITDDAVAESTELFNVLALFEEGLTSASDSAIVAISDDEPDVCPPLENITRDSCLLDFGIPDNLMCVDATNQQPACFSASELCNSVQFCENGADEGNLSGLDCSLTPPMFDCGSGTTVVLDVLCDGTLNCPVAGSGNDETDILCANKCLLPYYGGCSTTRKCTGLDNGGTSCGICLEGYIEVDPALPCIPIATIQFTQEVFEAEEGVSTVEVCVELSSVSSNVNPITNPIPVTVVPASDSATLGDDFDLIPPGMVFLTTLDPMDCVTFSIDDDMLPEGTEEFDVSLDIPMGDEFQLGDIATATVVILDNECIPMFIDDTPMVTGNQVAASFPDCVTAAMCTLPGPVGTVDCSGGLTMGPISRNTRVTLTVSITAPVVATLTRMIRRDNDQCDSHLINGGLIHTPGTSTATLEFEGTGPDPVTPITTFTCTVVDNIDGDNDLSTPAPCMSTSPYAFTIPAEVGSTLFVEVDPAPPAALVCTRMHTRVYEFAI